MVKTNSVTAACSVIEFQKLTGHAYYWLPVRKLAMLGRLENRIQNACARVVMDLEDGLWFPDNPAKTETCRASARESLVQGAGLLHRLAGRMALGIRLNPVDTLNFKRDLETLASIGMEWDCVFLPKVESGPDYMRAFATLSYYGISCRELIPIIETQTGLRRIKNVIAAAKRAGSAWIQYGHQDYSLSAGHWPFWEHDESRFKSHVEEIVAETEAQGLNYIHTPYLHLHDLQGFLHVQRWLDRVCKRPHAQATLSLGQTLACRPYASAAAPRSWTAESTGSTPACAVLEKSPIDIAKQFVEDYRRNSHSGRGFSVDAGTGRFFSPQEYQAALQFLAKNPYERG